MSVVTVFGDMGGLMVRALAFQHCNLDRFTAQACLCLLFVCLCLLFVCLFVYVCCLLFVCLFMFVVCICCLFNCLLIMLFS